MGAESSRGNNVTQEELQRALARERKLTEQKLRRELTSQQCSPQASSPVASTQPSTARVALYPNLTTYSQNAVNQNQTAAAVAYNNFSPSAPPAPVVNNFTSQMEYSKPGSSNNNMKCSTCSNLFGKYIYQCQSGHSACQDCKNSVVCGICRSIITSTRNFALEEHLENVTVACIYENEGCRLTFKVPDVVIHEKSCPFRALICPVQSTFRRCSWKGNLSELASHFKNMHPENCAAVGEERALGDIATYIRELYLITLGAYNFLVHVEMLPAEQKVKMAVQLCGHGAFKWDYELHVYKKNDPRKKYMYLDVCNCSSTPISEIFASNKCAVLPAAYFVNFVNSGSINYKIYIKKNVAKENPRSKQRNNRRRYKINNNRVVS